MRIAVIMAIAASTLMPTVTRTTPNHARLSILPTQRDVHRRPARNWFHLWKMAGHEVAVAAWEQLRFLIGAELLCLRATSPEPASGGRVGR